MNLKKAKKRTQQSSNSKRRLFCDTSIIYYLLHAQHPLLVAELARVIGERHLVLSNFVKGEYIRGWIYGLVILYTTIKTENNVSDGIQMFIAKSMGHHRRVQNALSSSPNWLTGQDSSDNVETTLERLADTIRNCLLRLNEEFPKRQLDTVRCDYGVLDFPPTTLSEDHILDLYEQIDKIRGNPTCDQCVFRDARMVEMAADGTDLHSEEQRKKYAKLTGYVKQAKNIANAIKTKLTGPSCRYCEWLGDTIIALQTPRDQVLLTGDASSYPALMEILKKDVEYIPSLIELVKRRDKDE